MNKYDARRYATPSSGDPEADQRAIEDHIRSSMKIDEGLCPNHPGEAAELVQLEPGTWECPNCKFVLYRRMIYAPPG